MNVLWMTYAPVGEACRALGFPPAQSGSWVDATAHALMNQPSPPRLTVATLAPIKEQHRGEHEGITYYCIPGGHAHRGTRAPKANKDLWKKVIEQIHPDVIHIWGSEFTDGLDLLENIKETPTLLTIQGVIAAIARYPNGGLSLKELRAAQPFGKKWIVEKYRRDAQRICAQMPYEQQLTRRVQGIILDSEWSQSIYHCIAPDTKIYRQQMPLNDIFQKYTWSLKTCTPHTIFCNAGRTPYKGIHMAVRALAIIRRQYPDVKLRIPGAINFKKLDSLRTPPYFRYLYRLAQQLGVVDCIEFPGVLAPEQMAQEMVRAQVFIMPSAIENQSSTLREAMMVGTPSVSANVGCIQEYLHHGENGYLYRYEEYELLAGYVMRLFDNTTLAERFSAKARHTICAMYVHETPGKELLEIYRNVVGESTARRNI